MSKYTFERLSAQDASFLMFEKPNTSMHVAATQIFDAGPLKTSDGGIDFDAFRRATAAVLHMIPRYRQKLRWIPFENHPVWVDDRAFNLDYHIRHTSLPKPGGIEQLKQLAARIKAQPLDRARPLWETWVVEGLEGDRFAVISKIHHCMVDGISGVDLAQILLSPTPTYEIPDAPSYIPRPSPSRAELLRDSFLRRASLPLRAIRSFQEFSRETEDLRGELWLRVRAVKSLLGWAVTPPSATPINGTIGPHRCFDWLSMSLEEVKGVRRAFGCTVNDVVLTTVTGAVREFLMSRRVNPEGIDFRISAPVSVRRDEERGKLGNRVSSWILRLPVSVSDPLEQLETIRAVTQELKESRQALGVEMMMAAAEWTPSVVLSLGSRAASGPINMVVTNVPGPQIPLYMLGAELLESFPQVPLLENIGLGVALFSYNGKMCWGFNADYDLVPDLENFVAYIKSSFEALRKAATARAELQSVAKPLPPVRRPPRKETGSDAGTKRRPRRVRTTPA